ncbi:hypothetical protein [Marinobacter sp.]|jgi:hypothetical protein|uniref:hypothetical protein n=1 Tax=Marinobacter sp. TaxID=50741 RepID=UPI0025BF98A8|nr:hypothetical protein [Marinobacter sp.]
MSTHFQHAREIGTLMCQATREILWQPAADWVRDRSGAVRLVCRVGAGQATYHRFDSTRRVHLINYGARMIAAKQAAESAEGWLSTREIRQRGYFEGEVSPLNLLAHTCCHEFAHLLQQSAGQRHYGSVHNRHFYRILDQLYDSGGAEATRTWLEGRAATLNVDLSARRLELPDPKAQAMRWQPGDAVWFGEGSARRQGLVRRVNRKTCTVDGTGKYRGSRYRVPFALLRRLGD